MAGIIKFLNFVFIGIGVAAGAGLIQYIFETKSLHKHIAPLVPSLWSFETKVTLVATLAAYISIFLMVHVLLVIVFRVIFGTNNPALREDPVPLKILTKSLTNSVEQTLIYLPLLAHWVLSHSADKNKHEAVLLTAIFLLGRVLFLLGYLFGSAIQLPGVRVFGLALTMGPSAIFLLRILGKAII